VLFKRNIQFSRLIKAGGRPREFNFRKPTPESITYMVDVGDERGNRFIWSMEMADGQWKIKGALLPQWIIDAEILLQAAIVEQENELGKINR